MALTGENRLFDREVILVFRLANQPSILGTVAKRFGEAKMNIDYIYGSAMEDAKESIFIVHIGESALDRVRDSIGDL